MALQVPLEIERRIVELAAATRQDPQAVFAELLGTALDDDEVVRLDVLDGLDELDRGEGIEMPGGGRLGKMLLNVLRASEKSEQRRAISQLLAEIPETILFETKIVWSPCAQAQIENALEVLVRGSNQSSIRLGRVPGTLEVVFANPPRAGVVCRMKGDELQIVAIWLGARGCKSRR